LILTVKNALAGAACSVYLATVALPAQAGVLVVPDKALTVKTPDLQQANIVDARYVARSHRIYHGRRYGSAAGAAIFGAIAGGLLSAALAAPNYDGGYYNYPPAYGYGGYYGGYGYGGGYRGFRGSYGGGHFGGGGFRGGFHGHARFGAPMGRHG